MSLTLLGVFLGLLSLVGYGVVQMIREAARMEERALEADRKAATARKQAEEMLKERSVEDVARDLDGGGF